MSRAKQMAAEIQIAKVAHQLWLDSGCPTGLDQEHWFRAEEMLRNELAAKCEARPSIPHFDTRTQFEIVAEFTSEHWDGHWEVWEREWSCARWVWDVRDSGVRAMNCAG